MDCFSSAGQLDGAKEEGAERTVKAGAAVSAWINKLAAAQAGGRAPPVADAVGMATHGRRRRGLAGCAIERDKWRGVACSVV